MSLNLFFNNLNFAFKHKKLYIIINYNTKIIKILKILIKNGFIFSYVKLNSKKIKIYLFKNLTMTYTILNLKKKYFNINLKFLNKNFKKFFILNTNKGILSNIEALSLNVGGYLICEII